MHLIIVQSSTPVMSGHFDLEMHYVIKIYAILNDCCLSIIIFFLIVTKVLSLFLTYIYTYIYIYIHIYMYMYNISMKYKDLYVDEKF